jgi:anti-sigma factor RsiW
VTCDEARALLWPPERPRLVAADVERAREHVRACPECVRYLAQDRALLDAYHRLREVEAPLEVRGRVFEALGRARAGPGTGDDRPVAPRARSIGLAAMLAVSVALVVWSWSASDAAAPPPVAGSVEDGRGAGVESAFVEDYLRRAVGEDYLESTDVEEIVQFLTRELGQHVTLLRLSELVPTRVEICLLEGRRGAMVVYRLDGKRVTHYLVPKAADARPPTVAPEHGDLAVVTWASGNLEEALVGEVSADTLLALARSGRGD